MFVCAAILTPGGRLDFIDFQNFTLLLQHISIFLSTNVCICVCKKTHACVCMYKHNLKYFTNSCITFVSQIMYFQSGQHQRRLRGESYQRNRGDEANIATTIWRAHTHTYVHL